VTSTRKPIVGYTSGVFDTFHVGHSNILKRAKAQCDYLIVGVTVDELVSYKDTQPLYPYEDRVEIIRNIKGVDEVVPQDHLDKLEMWKKNNFDVMFIGDDWKNTERFKEYEKNLATVGVKIIYLPYTKGVSTSFMKQIIKNAEQENILENLDNIYTRVKRKFSKSVIDRPWKNDIPIENISQSFGEVDRTRKKLVLGLQAGRGGMKWVCQIFAAHENANGGGERNRLAESFYRYIKYNNLSIDVSGIIDITKREALRDWSEFDISLISSPYFSHDFLSLAKEMQPDRVIWSINDPVFTVTSFYNKGWYSKPYIYRELGSSIGYQPALENEWSHYFGRLIPRGEIFEEWNALTRVGKIAWFLNETNKAIYSAISQFPEEKVWIFNLNKADQNYDYYLDFAESFGLAPIITKSKFLALKAKATVPHENTLRSWSAKEMNEYEKYSQYYQKIYQQFHVKASPMGVKSPVCIKKQENN